MFETDAAVEQLRAVIDARPTEPFGAVARARQQLRKASDRLKQPAYRLSIEGWRALERGDLDAAARSLTQSLALKPKDPVTQYRYARLLFAQKRDDEALPVLADIHKRHDETPPTIYTLACIDAARVHERQGATAIAISLYRSATTVFGGDRRMKEEARRHFTRLSEASR